MKNDTGNPFEVFNVPDSEKKSETLKSFTDELLNMKGELLEFFIGETSENLEFSEYSIPNISSIFGKLVEVYDRFILVDCLYIDKITKKLCTGNRIFINSFQLRCLTRLESGSLKDIFLNASDAAHVRKLLKQMHNK